MDYCLISKDVASVIVEAIEDATGDVIKEDLLRSNLLYMNSTSHRIWDHIYSLITTRLKEKGYVVFQSNSGPWKFPVVYDRQTGNIITLMREKRFFQLQRQQKKRKKQHYIDMLAAVLNENLQPRLEQLTVLEGNSCDLDIIRKQVALMLKGFDEQDGPIRNHVLVLFDASHYQLFSIRAVMVTPKLMIAQNGEESLSELIQWKPSAIVEKDTEPKALIEDPPFKLQLSAKAIARKKRVKLKNIDGSNVQTK